MKNSNKEEIVDVLNYKGNTITIVKQENLKKDKTDLYKTIARLLYEDTIDWSSL